MAEEPVLTQKEAEPQVLPEKKKEEGVMPVEQVKEKPELHKENAPEKGESKYREILSRITGKGHAAKKATDEEAALDSKSIAETMDKESKIQKLLDLASTKGVTHAVKVARSLGDYYALDRMHDTLADKLYAGLIERGLIHKE